MGLNICFAFCTARLTDKCVVTRETYTISLDGTNAYFIAK